MGPGKALHVAFCILYQHLHGSVVLARDLGAYESGPLSLVGPCKRADLLPVQQEGPTHRRASDDVGVVIGHQDELA